MSLRVWRDFLRAVWRAYFGRNRIYLIKTIGIVKTVDRGNAVIYEMVEIDVKAGTETQFEAGVTAGVPIFRAAKGCRGMELHRCVEQPNHYRLIVKWETIENHTVDFRQSPAFQQWRALVGAYLASTPQVEHTSQVLHAF